MSQFLDCLVDENYTVLGKGTGEQLSSAWLSIYSQYLNAIDKEKNEAEIKNIARIYSLSTKISMVKILCEGALKTGLECYFAGLEQWGYTAPDMASIKRIVAQLKADEMELNILIKSLPQKSDTKPTRDHFLQLIIDMEAMQGIELDSETLTVAKFCIYYNKLQRQSEAVKKQQQSQKRQV